MTDSAPPGLYDVPPRTVKPRSRSCKVLPVVAIHQGDCLAETGECFMVADIIKRLPEWNPTLFIALGAADFVGSLNSVYLLKTPNTWQWRASTHERDFNHPDGTIRASRVSAVVHYFGWKGGNYHKIIDPVVMYGHRLDTIWPDEVTVVDDPQWRALVKLLKWGITLRDFCANNDIDVRPTAGGISAQFLTDKRFYPNARRKVPAKTNERTRENLPGNHYYLNVIPDPSNNFTAYYLDQHRAHHYHARTADLPDSDHCYAYGDFTTLSAIAFDRTEPSFHGLYCLDLCAPKHQPAFSWINHDHLDRVFVYSNELQHLLDIGYVVNGVRAAWGSLKRDEGLGRYACWCEEQLDQYADAKWLKPLLLSTYGTLATRPRIAESVFRLANAGEPVTMRTGHRQLNGLLARGRKKLEPQIANVIHRGMIEAGCRSESIGLAQWLENLGHRTLSIYADAVIVEADDDKTLPLLPEPWRCKRELNHLQFINQQAFMSDGMTKLPGVSQEIRNYRQYRKPGHAPRLVQYDALTGQKVQTTRRI